MVELAIGAVLGVLTGLVAWWLIERASIPRLLLSSKVSKVRRTRGDETWRYSVKVVNARRPPLPKRPLVDVKAVLTLQVRGLDPDAPRNWNNYNVPLPNDGAIALLTDNSVLRIRTQRMTLDNKPLLAAAVADGDPDGLDLEQALQVGESARLRLIVTASNSYTHATTSKIEYYGTDAIETGRFSHASGPAGLQIVEAKAEDDDAAGDEASS